LSVFDSPPVLGDDEVDDDFVADDDVIPMISSYVVHVVSIVAAPLPPEFST
jgi:hypothetical protein